MQSTDASDIIESHPKLLASLSLEEKKIGIFHKLIFCIYILLQTYITSKVRKLINVYAYIV